MKLGNQTCVSAKSELVLARGLDTCSATGGVGVEVLVAADGLSASSAPGRGSNRQHPHHQRPGPATTADAS